MMKQILRSENYLPNIVMNIKEMFLGKFVTTIYENIFGI